MLYAVTHIGFISEIMSARRKPSWLAEVDPRPTLVHGPPGLGPSSSLWPPDY